MIDENGDTQREIGRQGGRLDSLERDMSELKTDVKAIRETLSQAKGGWKTLLMVGGAAGAVGAVIGKFIPFITGK